jgi:DNA-binding response OmpR family regulator
MTLKSLSNTLLPSSEHHGARLHLSEQMKNILLVEDSEEDAFFFKRALAKSGVSAELLLASDGKAAISLLSDSAVRSRLDTVFLDLKLPYFSGFDILNWIRSQNFDPRLCVIVLSGSDQQSDKAHAYELGADDYVVKPISPTSLRELLSTLCEK